MFKDNTKLLKKFLNSNSNFNTDTLNNDFETFYKTNQLEKIIPFLTERKFCHPNPDDRLRHNSTDTYYSNYPYFGVGTDNCKKEQQQDATQLEEPSNTEINCMQIRKYYGTIKEPDDIIKDNLINNFSYNFSIYINDLISNLFLLISGENNNTTYNQLNNYYEVDKKEDYKRLKYLTNKKNISFKKYKEVYYELNKYKFYIEIIINSLLIVCIIFIINGLMTKYKVLINVVLIGILILYVVLGINNVKDRDLSNWDKKYFSNSAYKIKETV